MSWIAVGVAVAGAVAGGTSANNTRQTQKGIIGKSYSLGQQRLNLSQLDTRQHVAEASGQRGLDNAGDVSTGAVATPGNPSVPAPLGTAHTLGGQQTADLAREQSLEQTSLLSQKNSDLATVNANADQAELSSITGAAGSAVGLHNSFKRINPVDPVGSGFGGYANRAAATSTANFNVDTNPDVTP